MQPNPTEGGAPGQNLADLVVRKALLGQLGVAGDAGPLGHQLVLELLDGVIDLALHLGLDAGQVEEDAVGSVVQVAEEAGGGADDAAAAQLAQGLAEVA